MRKNNILFWLFFVLLLFVSYQIYFYFISPLVVDLFQTDAMDLVIFPIVFIPLSLVLANASKDFFLSGNAN